MIQLRSDFLVFETSDGQLVPCSAEIVTVELMGAAAANLDPEVVQHAAAAVLHYFSHELGKNSISVAEFSGALEKTLNTLGFTVSQSEDSADGEERVVDCDLRVLACESGKGFELAFFNRLRSELREKLQEEPTQLRCRGLRGCVKQLTGVSKWSSRCQSLSDQIVDYIRGCLSQSQASAECAVIVE